MMRRRILWGVLIAVGVWLALTAVLQFIARPGPTVIELNESGGKRLVVIVHGMSGRDGVEPVMDVAREAFPTADVLDVKYDAEPLSNADPYAITDAIEARIHAAYLRKRYEGIVLVGHSMGAALVRKVLIWGHGEEIDRVPPRGPHEWVSKVERLVSLAGINRGWSIDPRPDNMTLWRYVSIWLGERLGRATGTGSLVLSVRRGAPFIADSRVQWIRLVRAGSLPQVIHLLGSQDDLVARADATDLGVARGTIFVTLPGTDHNSIAAGLGDVTSASGKERRQAVSYALRGELGNLSVDREQELRTIPDVNRIIYVVHGIRDHGDWVRDVRAGIETRLAQAQFSAPVPAPRTVMVNDTRYGYFAMLPFLLYADRQAKVRQFMDEYTENLAHYPDVKSFDYVGHSNGTYLLASALQHYRTINVRNVYFAGSVVPTHYPWRSLLDAGRVERVVNVVANGDWVVAIFPMVFEQVAGWMNMRPTRGALDLGGAGFRGFQDENDPQSRVRNIQYVTGAHSAGVDTSDRAKLDAIVDYALDGKEQGLAVFRNGGPPSTPLDMASNVQWLVILLLVAVVFGLGWGLFRIRWYLGLGYVALVVGLLNSI